MGKEATCYQRNVNNDFVSICTNIVIITHLDKRSTLRVRGTIPRILSGALELHEKEKTKVAKQLSVLTKGMYLQPPRPNPNKLVCVYSKKFTRKMLQSTDNKPADTFNVEAGERRPLGLTFPPQIIFKNASSCGGK